jgi:AraC-like DNA-binding protein
LEIGRIGIGVKHGRGFTIDRPKGSGSYVFLHFLTPIRLCSILGRRVEPAGSCLIYAPPHPQWYTAEDFSFNHDWFHFSGKGVPDLLRKYALPENTVVRPPHTNFIAEHIRDMEHEVWRNELHGLEAVALKMELFFLQLSRAMQTGERKRLTPYELEMKESFQTLRVAVREDPNRRWTVPLMAKEVRLSVSRFSVLHQRFFGLSPAQELMKVRLDRACWLLTNSTLSITDVAYKSGFTNTYYFSRLFHRKLGCPPRDYCRRPVDVS